MKATFFDRVLAYLIDFLIIGVLLSIVCFKLPNNQNKYNKELEDITNKFMESTIDEQAYIEGYTDILYKSQKSNLVETEVLVVLLIGYFIVFQYLNKGQTIGKKLLKIRVVDKDTKKPLSIGKGVLRSIFILNIFSSIVGIICLYAASKNTYLYCYLTVSGIESLIILITIFFVLYRKDGRGLHDMMAQSIVIKE